MVKIIGSIPQCQTCIEPQTQAAILINTGRSPTEIKTILLPLQTTCELHARNSHRYFPEKKVVCYKPSSKER